MTMTAVLPAPHQRIPASSIHVGDAKLRDAALKLEASFLSEMLKSAGLGSVRQSMGGGIGEEQFSSFLRDAQAREMAERGGIGLAQSLFEALKERQINDVHS